MPEWVGAAPTTPGRVSTARWCGSGKRDEKEYARNQRFTSFDLDVWIGWARRCRIRAFVDLQRRIVKNQASILAAIEHGLSNGRIESVNTKIRLITRVGGCSNDRCRFGPPIGG